VGNFLLDIHWRLNKKCQRQHCNHLQDFSLLQCHHMSLMDFVVSPSGCGRSVTEFWGWDAHEAQLRCPGVVDGDIWIWSAGRSLKPKFY
jgi:hypothetical protein